MCLNVPFLIVTKRKVNKLKRINKKKEIFLPEVVNLHLKTPH